MRFILYILCCFSLFLTKAAEVNITGTAGSYYHGQSIYLMQVEECLLGSKKLLAESKVGITGNFSFKINSEEIHSVEIQSAFISFPFKIESDKNYKVELINPSENEYVSLANNTVKDILFYGLNESDINAQIIIFNNKLDSLLDAELVNFNQNSYYRSLQAFYAEYNNKTPFLKEYAQAAIAQQILNFSKDRKAFFLKYIDGNNFNLSNQESVNLLSDFYGSALKKLLRFENAKSKQDISNANAEAYLKLFKNWDFCNTTKLLSFAAISNAYSIYINGDYTETELLNILKYLETALPSPTTSLLSKAIYKNLGLNFQPVISSLINEIEIDYSKKALVLCFYSQSSVIAMRELNEMEQIAKNGSMPLQLIKVCSDCGNNSGINSDINISSDPILFDSLRLYGLPKFTLLSTEKKIIKEWLEPPSHGAESQIMTILMRRGRP